LGLLDTQVPCFPFPPGVRTLDSVGPFIFPASLCFFSRGLTLPCPALPSQRFCSSYRLSSSFHSLAQEIAVVMLIFSGSTRLIRALVFFLARCLVIPPRRTSARRVPLCLMFRFLRVSVPALQNTEYAVSVPLLGEIGLSWVRRSGVLFLSQSFFFFP